MLSHETTWKLDRARKRQQTTKWYIHVDRDDVLTVDENALDGLQFGGKRNYGYGITRLKDTQVGDLEALDHSRLENGETFILELVAPFVLESEYPNGHDQDVLWWWKKDRRDLCEREEKLLEQREVSKLQTVDQQVVAFAYKACGNHEERHPPGRQSLGVWLR